MTWKDYLQMVNRQLGNFTSPISHHHSVPSNSPINIPFTDHLLPKADELNRALNDAITKLSDPPNLPTYGAEFRRKDKIRLENQEINENFNFVKNSGLIPKTYYGESPFRRKESPKLNPEAKPFQSQNFHYSPDIEDFNGIFHHKINAIKPPQEPLRSVKLEFEIKKLIKEMQELENSNKKSVGHGDEEIKKFETTSIKNYPMQHLVNNNNPLIVENCGISENLMTRKFCHIDLIKSQNQLGIKQTQVEGREWETKEEKEVHIINPDYSSSENDEEPKLSGFNSPFFNVDLCMNSNSGGSLPDSGAKGDICAPDALPVLNTIDTQGDILTPEFELEKKKSGMKTLPLNISSSSTSKKGKKKKSFGQRILSFFGKNKSPSTSNHVNCGITKDTK